jgi:hypothetical protein
VMVRCCGWVVLIGVEQAGDVGLAFLDRAGTELASSCKTAGSGSGLFGGCRVRKEIGFVL